MEAATVVADFIKAAVGVAVTCHVIMVLYYFNRKAADSL